MSWCVTVTLRREHSASPSATMRYIIENTGVPRSALIWYSAISLTMSLLCDNALVLILWPGLGTVIMVVVCNYYISAVESYLRRRFRLYLSCVGAAYGTIVGGQVGLETFQFSIAEGLIIGFCFGVAAYLVSTIASAVVDPILNRVRRFAAEGECTGCGYNLFGNTSGICPECGSPVPLHMRRSIMRTETGETASGVPGQNAVPGDGAPSPPDDGKMGSS